MMADLPSAVLQARGDPERSGSPRGDVLDRTAHLEKPFVEPGQIGRIPEIGA